jgi:L-asparaginase/Glu-tRNA(Gln) amidotransferase subunit D
MTTDPLLQSLRDFKERMGKPLRVVVANTGGTFTCLPNDKGLLEPIQKKEQLEKLFFDGLNLGSLVKRGLLDLKLIHVFAVDSSQMEDSQRDQIVKAIHAEYVEADGFIIPHGTDTAADTAKFLHLALPYYDPRAIWRDQGRAFNWGKPVLVLSSQVPAIDSVDGELSYRIDSDGPMNLSLALILIADGNVGETGVITNNGDALHGAAAEKGAEVDIPPFRTDPGVAAMAKYTALGLRYLPQGYLQKAGEGRTFVPFVIQDSAEYKDKVITVYDSSHLNTLKAFIESEGEAKKELRKKLPKVIIYISKGAGNVLEADYAVLKAVESEGVFAFRVPLPGGRIPMNQLYDVPGHDIPALNMQPQTAKYKAMMTLHLGDKVLNVKQETKKEFINKMMREPWANEFLPQR